MKEDRQYQAAAINNIPYYLRDYGSVIYQGPTGSGKSHIINRLTQRIITSGKIPLILSDNKKIHSQLIKECSGIRIDSGVDYAHIMNGHCYVAMAQSLKNRHRILDQFRKLEDDLIVINDECHRNTATPVIYDINPCWLVGFSATPHYKWAKHLPELYNSLIAGPQIKELINSSPQYLCHYKHVLRTGAALDELELKGQDYSEESQEKVFGSKRMYDGIFEDLPKYKGKKTVIYVASIKACEDMYLKLLEKGYKVCRYHTGKKYLPNPAYELSKFTELELCDICVSVGSLTLGWDFPPIDLVVLWRATTSLPLYLQIGGRGSRPWPGKELFTILDYGGNYERFGAWDMDRDWYTLWQNPEKKRKISTYAGVDGSKLCPICQALLPIAARSCYNCGYLYPEDEMKLIEGQLIEVENSLKAIKNRMVSSLTPKELADYSKLHDKRNYAMRVAMRQEQDTPGFLKEFSDAMGYKRSWLNRKLENLPKHKIIYFNQVVQ